MNRKEFEEWINHHGVLFPKVHEYLGNEAVGQVRQHAWYEAIGHLGLAECKRASEAMTTLTGRDRPFSPEDHPGYVIAQVTTIRNSEASTPPRYFDGQRAHKCRLCEADSGYVTIWNPLYLHFLNSTYVAIGENIPSDWKDSEAFREWREKAKPKFKGGALCVAVCNCVTDPQRRERAEKRREALYDEDKHCTYRHGDIRNVQGWLESREAAYPEFENFNEAPSSQEF